MFTNYNSQLFTLLFSPSSFVLYLPSAIAIINEQISICSNLIFAQSAMFESTLTNFVNIPNLIFCKTDIRETHETGKHSGHESLFQGGWGEQRRKAQRCEVMPLPSLFQSCHWAQLQVNRRPGVSQVVSEVRVVRTTPPGHWQPAPGYRGSSQRSAGELSWRIPAALRSPSHTPPAPAPTGGKRAKFNRVSN